MAETLISTGPLEVISNRHAGNAKRPEKPPFPDVQGYFHGDEGWQDCWTLRAARWCVEPSSKEAPAKVIGSRVPFGKDASWYFRFWPA
jgi:hypothetical protein